ncbi:MAG TPA: GDP-mannose 4,6-dehydratase [Candidatus Aquilonibacter sp.]
MRILVTGGAGFIGSHLAQALLERGDEVVAIDDLSTGSLENIAHLFNNARFSFVESDIRNAAALNSAMSGCDRAVHLAARIGLKIIVESPLETIRVNAGGTEVVLDAASRHGVPVLVASTSEVYGLSTRIPSAESDPICFGSPAVGRWSYACAKAFDEFYALALHRERGLTSVVIRLFNTVGPRQTGRYGMVIPRLVSQALMGEPLTVYGDGTQTRCFCSVDDVTHVLVYLIERAGEFAGEVFNIGNPQETSILALAERVIELTGSSSPISFVPFDVVYPDGFEEIQRRVPDITKARKRLGFRPQASLDDVLISVIDGVKKRKELVG